MKMVSRLNMAVENKTAVPDCVQSKTERFLKINLSLYPGGTNQSDGDRRAWNRCTSCSGSAQIDDS